MRRTKLRPERVPFPRVGEVVRLQVADAAHVGVYQARVRALGLRRIVLESAEAVTPSEDLNQDAYPTPNLPREPC